MCDVSSNTRQKDFIKKVLRSFYQRAVSDFLIGYQFRKIKEAAETTFEDIFFPELEAFSSHLARIEAFWLIQLLGMKKPEGEPGFDLVRVHLPLRINAGELSRWLLLFKEVLKEEVEKQKEDRAHLEELAQRWESKVDLFATKIRREILGA